MPGISKKVAVTFLFTACLVCSAYSPGAGEHRRGSVDEEALAGMSEGQRTLEDGYGPEMPVAPAGGRRAGGSVAPILSATPSLTVDDQVHLGAASDLFKAGSPFIWDDASNTGLGRKALVANTTGIGTTASGAYALYANTTGSYNVANGTFALKSNTEGEYNTAIGSYAMFYNDTASTTRCRS